MCRGLSKQMHVFVVFVMVVLSSTLNAQDPSLVLYFSFDDDVAGEAADHSMYRNNGTLGGNPAPAQGKFGSALTFDAVDDQVVVPTSATLDIEDKITLMAWINAGANLTADWRTVVGKSPTSVLGNVTFSYDIRTDQTGVLRFSLNIGAWQYILGPTVVPGTWYHIAGTYDGSQMVFYVDGAPVGTTQTSGKIRVTPDPVCVGNIVNAAGAGSNEYWSGIIDEVRIWNRALSEDEVKTNMAQGKGELLEAQLALSPEPGDGQTDVLRGVSLGWSPGKFANTHDVYFGTVFDDVNNAGRTNPRGVLASQGQLATSYDPPGRLDLGQTYYWRVDEVNAPPDSTIFKGNVWSFTVEPIAYPIDATNITATASSSNKAEEGPENTVNGSGLNASDSHSAANTDMWLSSMTGAQPTWIQYEFDRVHKLHQMMVWNYNTTIEPAIGFGVKEAAIEYSTDGANWTPLGATHEFARGPGSAGYAANTTIDLGGVAAKYVKITVNSNWGGFVKQYGLSEVRFFSVPVVAREPSPNPGATGVDVDVILSFRPGREAAKHNVYLSTDEQAVIDGTVPVATVTEPSYASSLDLAGTYFWRIDEVNDAEIPTTWQSDIWNLSTQEYLVVDDFESYNDIDAGQEGSTLVYGTWIDGFGTTTNGSTIGYFEAFQPSMENTLVYDGSQSVPLFYDNTVATYSEVTANIADLQAGQDWAKHGIKALTLHFYGDPNNSVNEQMYVKLNGSKVTYAGDAENLKRIGWQMWYVDLASIGVSLSNVTELSIGFERTGAVGGRGVVYLDGIRLYSYDRQEITPVDPDPTGLQAHYEFEGTYSDSSGNARHGTAMGNPAFVAGEVGQAINLDGVDDYVQITGYKGILGSSAVTVTAWVRTTSTGTADTGSNSTNAIVGWGPNVAGQRFGFRVDAGRLRAEHHGGNVQGDSSMNDGGWHHVAVTVQENATVSYPDVILYLDGADDTKPTTDPDAFNLIAAEDLRIGSRPASNDRFFQGQIDEVRIYDRALTQEEIAWLSGRTLPFDKPF